MDKVEELKKELNNSEKEPKEPKEPEEPKEGFVEIEGAKYKEDPSNPGQALLDPDENPIPFEEKKEEEKEEFKMPEKFKDKSPEEIAKSYVELEKMVGKKVGEGIEVKIEELIKEGKITKVEAEKIEKEIEEKKPPLIKEEEIDFAGMTPKKFADWMDKRVEKRISKILKDTEERIGKILTSRDEVRTNIRNEVSEARKDHPLLKENKEYTELVLAIVEAASSRGKPIKLGDACTKVDKLLGKKKDKDIDEEAKEKLKKAKAIVETPGGAAPGGGKETEEERIKRKLLEGSESPMGGLGI